MSADPHPAENQEDKIFTPGPGTTSGYGRCVQSLWQPRGGLANLAQRMQLRHREPGTISVGSHLPRKATKLTPCEVASRTLTSIFVSVAALSPGISLKLKAPNGAIFSWRACHLGIMLHPRVMRRVVDSNRLEGHARFTHSNG